jgi:hypothetical protein
MLKIMEINFSDRGPPAFGRPRVRSALVSIIAGCDAADPVDFLGAPYGSRTRLFRLKI